MRSRVILALAGSAVGFLLLSLFIAERRARSQSEAAADSPSETGGRASVAQQDLGEPPSSVAANRSSSAVERLEPSLKAETAVSDPGPLSVLDGTYPSGELAGRVLVDAAGRRQGEFIAWHKDGSVKRRGRYESDMKVGPWVSFYPDGTVQDLATYVDGELVGSLQMWYPNGQLSVSKTIRNGKGNGPCSMWYESGRLLATGEIEDSFPTGSWTYWNEDGTLDTMKTGTYQKGKRVD